MLKINTQTNKQPKEDVSLDFADTMSVLRRAVVFLERFSFECRKVIGSGITTLHDWLKKLAPLFIQSEVKPKPIATHSLAFSRALRQRHVITTSFDWFTVLSVSFLIG